MSALPVSIPVTYCMEWDDGFGARGWKVNSAIGDPAVIAATSETGDRIPTSVLIHDMLDHYLCGLKMSGHRNEACALIQLASRTHSDPTPDFTQMVEEDLLYGNVNGETFSEFAGEALRDLAPPAVNTDLALLNFLKESIGEAALKRILVKRFFNIGNAYTQTARQIYEAHGLNYEARDILGLRLQELLRQADRDALRENWETCQALFELGDDSARLRIVEPVARQYDSVG